MRFVHAHSPVIAYIINGSLILEISNYFGEKIVRTVNKLSGYLWEGRMEASHPMEFRHHREDARGFFPRPPGAWLLIISRTLTRKGRITLSFLLR